MALPQGSFDYELASNFQFIQHEIVEIFSNSQNFTLPPLPSNVWTLCVDLNLQSTNGDLRWQCTKKLGLADCLKCIDLKGSFGATELFFFSSCSLCIQSA